MDTTHAKHEEYSSNVVRVLHPTQPISPKVKDMDSNLDYLLEDLQSSVSPPNYAFGGDVQYLSPANTTTILKERSVSPGREERRVYSAAAYQYSTSTNLPSEPAQNVNQLDTLLQDLKTERDITRERDYSLATNTGVDPGLLETGSHVNKSTRVYTTVTRDGKPSAQRELLFDSADENRSGIVQQRSPSYIKKLDTKTIRDISYDTVKPYDVTSEESSKAITLKAATLPDDLKDVPLSDDILPVPGTKVTTTVRTYTYEIPAETSSISSKTLLYKNESHNTTNTTYPARSVPPAIVIKTESYKTLDKTDGVPISNEPPTSTVKAVIQQRDVRETTTSGYPDKELDYPKITSLPTSDTTIVYKYDTTNKTRNVISPSNKYAEPHSPPNRPYQDRPGYPTANSSGPTTTYYYKHESSNTTNTTYGPPFEGKPPSDLRNRPEPKLTDGPDRPYPGYPDQKGAYYPKQPTVIKYEYSHSSTTNTQGVPSEREPLLQPAPFPVDGVDHSTANGHPPRRLDDLLASFDGNVNDKQSGVDESVARRKEVETAVASPGEPRIPTKNIAGPPVYYPPGHEMFTRKEESSAAYRAQGGYARASGRYEYEAESKSKTKTRSGAAVVPVCLPLCCAMPCSIM